MGTSVRLQSALPGARAVLFLCSGNMVRSAFAELWARHRGIVLPVASAATTYRNDRLLSATAEALRSRGVAVEAIRAFRPRHLGGVIGRLDADTLVLGMTREHLAALAARPELERRACLLAEALGSEEEIADPVLEGADFARTFAAVERAVDALCAALARRGDAGGGP